MLQDISPYRLNNHYDPYAKADDDSFIIAFDGQGSEKKVLIGKDMSGDLTLPRKKDIGDIAEDQLIYLFSIDKELFFLWDAGTCISAEGFDYSLFREIRRQKGFQRLNVFAIFTAYHLSEWYESARFCGRCGSATSLDTVERAVVCPKCGNKIYPRINPAVIIGVTDKENNKLILTKYRTGFAQNALVAGFTEIGETLEETVKREVMEEVGLEVDNIRYYKSQPWGVALDILSGFYCDVVGNRSIKMDDSELKYAEWVAPEDIILQDPDYSLTNEMMKLFKTKGYQGTLGDLRTGL